MRPNKWINRLALSMALVSLSSMAYADPNATKPYTASELPIMSTTPNLIYGTYGPQVKLDAPTFGSIPHPIYLDKTLEEQLGAGSIEASDVVIEYNDILKLENESLGGSKSYDLEGVKQVAQDALNKALEKSGYLCDAVVTAEGGVIKLQLTPLAVSSVDVSSEDGWQGKVLNHLLRGIRSGEPLNLADAEKQIRLTQANPDLVFTAELEAVPYTHEVKVKVSSTEHKVPFHLAASVNNLDQIIFGEGFVGLTAVANNVTGHGDSLMIAPVRGYRSTGIFSRYEYPFTPALRGTIDLQYADIAPYNTTYVDETSKTDGMAYRISPGLKYTFLDEQTRRMSADINFDIKQSNTKNGPDVIEREVVRTLRGGVNYDQKWEKTSLSTRHEFALATPIFSGSLANDPRLSWFKAGSQYWRYTGYATLSRSMPWESTGSLNLQWQYSPDGVSNFDVGGLGGTFYGRGYREVFLFVDSYAILNAQWQVPAKFLPKGFRLPFASKDLRDTTQLVTFVDYGYGDTTNAPANYDGNDHILSTGFGVRSQLTDRVNARLDVGFPLFRELPFSQAPRLHFGIDTLLF